MRLLLDDDDEEEDYYYYCYCYCCLLLLLIYIWILTFTSCNFCGNGFLVIGRHSWCCKARSRSSPVNDDIVTNGNTSNMDHTSLYLDNQHNNQSSSVLMCCCGKHCKGYKELKIHQQSCKFIFGLKVV